MKDSKVYFFYFFSIVFLFFSSQIYGQNNYYFSSISGNDAASGTSSGSPWLSISKLNELLPSLEAGDIVYFERGSFWSEVELELQNKSGTSSNPITFTAYGSGPRPILSGGKVINNFTKSGNIYTAEIQKDFPNGHIKVPTGVLINGVWKDIARSPEYFTMGTNSFNELFDDNQSWTPDELIGAYVIPQPRHWQWNPSTITSNTSTSITFQPIEKDLKSSTYFAYYIANSDNFLNTEGDWTFRDRNLNVYYNSDLNSEHVQFGMVDTMFFIDNCSYIDIEEIVFELANYRHVSVNKGEFISITDCEFRYNAGTGVRFYRTDNIVFKNNYVHDCGAAGIWLSEFGPADIKNNLFRRIAVPHIGIVNYDFRMGPAVTIHYPSSPPQIQYNYFDSVGLAIQGHTFQVGVSANISCNYVQNYGISVSDCGAFYFASDLDSYTNKYISRNIIRDVSTAGDRYYPYGSNASNPHPTLHPHAIYLDENAYGYVCDSNSIINTSIPFLLNRTLKNSFNYNNVVRGDTNITDLYSTTFLCDQAIGDTTISADSDTLKYNNIVLSNRPGASVYLRHTIPKVIDLGIDNNNFYFDYNKIASPFNADPGIGKYVLNYGWVDQSYTLAEMQADGGGGSVSAIPTDLNSTVNPQIVMYDDVSGQVSEEDFVKFYTNFSNTTKTFNTDGTTYRDIDGNLISGTFSIPPFYSKILFYQSGTVNNTEIDENYIDTALVPALLPVDEDIVNHTPQITSVEFNVPETDPLPLYIGTIPAEDQDYAQGLSFSIIAGDANNVFNLNNSGELFFNSTVVDFSQDTIFNLTVRVNDNGTPSLYSEANIRVNLLPDHTNYPPEIPAQEILFRIEAHIDLYTIKVIASDPNEDDDLTYTIISAIPAALSLNPETGDLSYTLPEEGVFEPLSYELEIQVSDNGTPSISTTAIIDVTIIPYTNIYYIDPTNTQQGDGSFTNPYVTLMAVDFQADNIYLIKRGTVNLIDKITIPVSNIRIGSYGEGDIPYIYSSANDFVFMSVDKENITFEDLHIVAENAISCVYVIGLSSENIYIKNCSFESADYGIRGINISDVKIQYCKFFNNDNGLYVRADKIEANYNVFAHNELAFNMNSAQNAYEIYNNVFYDNRESIVVSGSKLKLLNNIFYLSENSDKAIEAADPLMVSDHNIFYPVNDGFISIAGNTFNNLEDMQADNSHDLNSKDLDPEFINLNQNDYSLLPTSPAIDAGIYVGIWTDIFGNPIPSGLAPDIGVVEIDHTLGGLNISDIRSNIRLYPNPVQNELHLIMSSTHSTSCRIEIFDLQGKHYIEERFQTDPSIAENHFSFSTTGLEQGLYFVQIIDGHQSQIMKFIKVD